jgi:hypothetical protein
VESNPANEASATPTPVGARVQRAWRRVEDFYSKWRLLCTIVIGLAGFVATALVARARELDILEILVLSFAVGTLVYLVFSAAKTKKWAAPAISVVAIITILTVSLMDWRTSTLQSPSSNPVTPQSAVQVENPPTTSTPPLKKPLVSTPMESPSKQDPLSSGSKSVQSAQVEDLRDHVMRLENALQQVIKERDDAVAALRTRPKDSLQVDATSQANGAELLRFVEAYAIPAKTDLIPLLNISSGDSDLDIALDRFLAPILEERQSTLIAQLHPEEFRGNVQAFCTYFSAYQETVRWFYKLASRWPSGDWYATGINPQRYRVWQKKDELFLQQLRVLLANPNFAGMRGCIDKVGYDELLRAGPAPRANTIIK